MKSTTMLLFRGICSAHILYWVRFTVTNWVPVIEKEEKKVRVRILAKLQKYIDFEKENIETIV